MEDRLQPSMPLSSHIAQSNTNRKYQRRYLHGLVHPGLGLLLEHVSSVTKHRKPRRKMCNHLPALEKHPITDSSFLDSSDSWRVKSDRGYHCRGVAAELATQGTKQ